ncbi:hypothetical protein BH09BAC1_BH09BAC1_04580 [soil metagenome]
MNHELKTAYNALLPHEREQLRHEFSNSPKTLLLLGFLEDYKSNDFGNQQVIPYLYGEDKSSFETLRNRYFKLRKNILDSISSMKKPLAGDGLHFPEEQAELYQIKMLIKQEGHYSIALQKLEALIKKFWRENLFEILPEAIQAHIYCRQVLGEYHQNEPLYKQWELAIELQRDMNQVRLLSAKALNGFYDEGFPKVLEVMKSIKRLIEKRKDYPRFALAYHLSHVLNGAGTMGNKHGALTRHIQQYEALRKQHPVMPSLNYERNHLWTERFRYLYAKGMYNYMKDDLKGFYLQQAEAYQLTERIPELRGARSERMFMNKLRTEVLLELYHEAEVTAQQMQVFQKEHKLLSNIWKPYLELGRMYVYSFPKVKPEDFKAFINLLERKLQNAAQAMNDNDKGEAFGIVAILQFYAGDYQAALKNYEQSVIRSYFESSGIGIFHQVFQLPFGDNGKAAQLVTDIKKIQYKNDSLSVRNLLAKAVDMVTLYNKRFTVE